MKLISTRYELNPTPFYPMPWPVNFNLAFVATQQSGEK